MLWPRKVVRLWKDLASKARLLTFQLPIAIKDPLGLKNVLSRTLLVTLMTQRSLSSIVITSIVLVLSTHTITLSLKAIVMTIQALAPSTISQLLRTSMTNWTRKNWTQRQLLQHLCALSWRAVNLCMLPPANLKQTLIFLIGNSLSAKPWTKRFLTGLTLRLSRTLVISMKTLERSLSSRPTKSSPMVVSGSSKSSSGTRLTTRA